MTLPNPTTDAFWQGERGKLWDEISDLVMIALLAGASGGVNLLPAEIRVLVNWNVFNDAALGYLYTYSGSWIASISATTRRQTVQAIANWMGSNQPLTALDTALTPIFGENRASMIAATEVTRIYAEGNQMAWAASGVVTHNRWMTVRDRRVCPLCEPLDGMLIPLGSNGFTTEAGGLGVTGPPIHTSCRCRLQPYVDAKQFDERRRRELGL